MVKVALPLAMMLFLAACTTNAGNSCAGFKPIRPVIADVDAMSAGNELVTTTPVGRAQ